MYKFCEKVKYMLRKSALAKLRRKILFDRFYFRFKNDNPQCYVTPVRPFPIDNVSVGKYSYGDLDVLTNYGETKLLIGSCVSIAKEVTFLLDVDHYTDRVSTYPFEARMFVKEKMAGVSKGDIVVCDDVWIGYRSTILSGVHIGQGAVIAAGSVVTKDVPPYSIVGGIPARVIKYRFAHEVIDYLMRLDYSLLTDDLIKSHLQELNSPIQELSFDEVRERLSWFPKRRDDNG